MSKKAMDGQGRWRSKTIAFRMSPEENQLLDSLVRLPGLTRQECIIGRVLAREIHVDPSPRVHKALKEEIGKLCEQLCQLNDVGEMSPEMIVILDFLGEIYEKMCVHK